jgi:hypothetical protein
MECPACRAGLSGENLAKIEQGLINQLGYWSLRLDALVAYSKMDPPKKIDRDRKHTAHMVKIYERQLRDLRQHTLI